MCLYNQRKRMIHIVNYTTQRFLKGPPCSSYSVQKNF